MLAARVNAMGEARPCPRGGASAIRRNGSGKQVCLVQRGKPEACTQALGNPGAAEPAPGGESLKLKAGEQIPLVRQRKGWKCVSHPGNSMSGAQSFQGGKGERHAVWKVAGYSFLFPMTVY